jgi:2-oxoglutarate dehydrogenase E1 component
MDKFSYVGNADVNAMEDLFLQFQKDPESVDKSWQDFFKGFDFARSTFDTQPGAIPENVIKEFKVISLINGYRQRGHLFTLTNPVRTRRMYSPDLSVENFGLSAQDLDQVFQAGIQIGIGAAKLTDIIAHLKQTYCQSIGVEYLYVRQPEIVKWLQERMERTKNTPTYTKEEKIDILKKVTKAVVFENFLHTICRTKTFFAGRS